MDQFYSVIEDSSLIFSLQYVLKMKAIMEESKIVQTFSILLYSRTYQTLYIEIYDIETKDLHSKHVITTSEHVEVHLSRPLKQIHMMIKKNQQNTQILHEFKFRVEDFSNNSTLQEFQNYIKLKKTFSQYSLLFQVFYRLPSFNSLAQLTRSSSAKTIRKSQENRKRQYLNQIKQLTSSNLNLLQYNVLSQYQKYIKKQTTPSLFQEEEKLQDLKRRKIRVLKTYNPKPLKYKKQIIKKNSIQKHQELKISKCKSQRQFGHEKKQQQQQQSVISFVQKSILKNQPTFVRKNKKTNTYQYVEKNQNNRNKITFCDKKDFNLDFSDNQSIHKKYSIIKQRTQQSTHQESINTVKFCKKQLQLSESQSDGIHNLKKQKINIKLQNKRTIKPIKIINEQKKYKQAVNTRQIQVKTGQIYKQVNFQNICFKKPNQRINQLKRCMSGNKNKLFKKEKIYQRQNEQKNIFILKPNQNIKLQKKESLNKFQKRNTLKPQICSLISRNHSSKQQFYRQLYLKTIKSIQRQSKVLNYVKRHCQTQLFNKNKIKQKQAQQLNKTCNIYWPLVQTNKQQKIFKLKKKKAQQQYICNSICNQKIRCKSSMRRTTRSQSKITKICLRT